MLLLLLLQILLLQLVLHFLTLRWVVEVLHEVRVLVQGVVEKEGGGGSVIENAIGAGVMVSVMRAAEVDGMSREWIMGIVSGGTKRIRGGVGVVGMVGVVDEGAVERLLE